MAYAWPMPWSARISASPIAGEDLVRLLLQRGFTLDEYANSLVADLTKVRAARDPRVERCREPGAWAEASARAFCEGTDPAEPLVFVGQIMATHPEVEPLVIREGERIVTTGCWAPKPDGIAALFATSTSPDARGKGYHTALIADRLARAIESGAVIARAGAKPASISEENFRKHGFEVLYTRSEWVLKA